MKVISSLSFIVSLLGSITFVQSVNPLAHKKAQKIVNALITKRRKLQESNATTTDISSMMMVTPVTPGNMTFGENSTGVGDISFTFDTFETTPDNMTFGENSTFGDDDASSMFDMFDMTDDNLNGNVSDFFMDENMTAFINDLLAIFENPLFMETETDLCAMIENVEGEEAPQEIICNNNCENNIMEMKCESNCSLCLDPVVNKKTCYKLSLDGNSNMDTNNASSYVTTKYDFTKGQKGSIIETVETSLLYQTCAIAYVDDSGKSTNCNTCEVMTRFCDYDDKEYYKADCSNIDSKATNVNTCNTADATFTGIFAVVNPKSQEDSIENCSLDDEPYTLVIFDEPETTAPPETPTTTAESEAPDTSGTKAVFYSFTATLVGTYLLL